MIKTKAIWAIVPLISLILTMSPAQAQGADAAFRVNQLEEQVRQLNGRIEELTFQLLQMQELVRKMQEDNEFRFQELEKRGEASGPENRPSIADLIDPADGKREDNRLGKAEPSEQQTSVESSGGSISPKISSKNTKRTIDGVEIYDGSDNLAAAGPRPLGAIVYDENGNVVDSTVGAPIDLTKRLYGGGDTQVRNAIPANPEELYSLGYNYVQSGDYELAEETFRDFIEKFPDHLRIPDAHFWLGESLFSRKQYEEAAKVFLTSHKNWPDARLAPQTLLKLGIAVAGLDQRELACATFAQVGQKYPDASPAVKRNVKDQQKAVRCTLN